MNWLELIGILGPLGPDILKLYITGILNERDIRNLLGPQAKYVLQFTSLTGCE